MFTMAVEELDGASACLTWYPGGRIHGQDHKDDWPDALTLEDKVSTELEGSQLVSLLLVSEGQGGQLLGVGSWVIRIYIYDEVEGDVNYNVDDDYQARAKRGRPKVAAQSAGFSQIKKIPYQAPPTQLGPRKCTF